jgi:hypothetical protein
MSVERDSHKGSPVHESRIEQAVGDDSSSMGLKLIVAWEIGKIMSEQDLNIADMAKKMGMGKAVIKRLLIPTCKDMKLHTLHRAAMALGKQLEIRLIDRNGGDGEHKDRPKLTIID